MYEQVVTYITAIAPSLATVVTAVAMFIKIVTRTREMTEGLKHNADEQAAITKAQVEELKAAVKQVTDSNEIAVIKEENAQLRKDMQEVIRLNAELQAKLNQRC